MTCILMEKFVEFPPYIPYFLLIYCFWSFFHYISVIFVCAGIHRPPLALFYRKRLTPARFYVTIRGLLKNRGDAVFRSAVEIENAEKHDQGIRVYHFERGALWMYAAVGQSYLCGRRQCHDARFASKCGVAADACFSRNFSARKLLGEAESGAFHYGDRRIRLRSHAVFALQLL